MFLQTTVAFLLMFICVPKDSTVLIILSVFLIRVITVSDSRRFFVPYICQGLFLHLCPALTMFAVIKETGTNMHGLGELKKEIVWFHINICVYNP